MTDKEIEGYLVDLINQKEPISIFEAENELDKITPEKFMDYLGEYIDYDYLENEIKIIKQSGMTDDNYIIYSLTSKGRKVIRLGGWLKYLERKDKIEEKKELKQDYELKIAEFQSKNPRLPYYIAFGSFIIAMLSFINSCSSDNKKSTYKKETRLHKTESTISPNTNLVMRDSISVKN